MTAPDPSRPDRPGSLRQFLGVLGLTLVFLVVLDVMVAGLLGLAQSRGVAGSLVRYFEYGRSVPGKLEAWQAAPEAQGNLFDVGWIEAQLNDSLTGPDAPGGVVRSYGMSFVDNILRQAVAADPALAVDRHAGPGAPPNYTYAVFLDDHLHRQAGDVAVLGILSSSVPSLAALSNRTWVFEQPAPYTYPVFTPAQDGGLSRIDPLITSPAQERALAQDPAAEAAWTAQLAQEDAFYGAPTFGATALDVSPFARLVRRALAKSHVSDRKTAVLAGGFPYAQVLSRMVTGFAEQAQTEGVYPVVFLIQTRDPNDPDLLAVLGPVLQEHGIPYLATAEHVDPRDPTAFVGDGHYTHDNDRLFAEAFLRLMATRSAAQ
ncbi:hypothetical protein [Roseobacter sinensis]|uniref:DUF1574 domain-containing protein n=1 Tax=Roseobacter sinensis TaxID=2931391 RepID=A0ABT3BJP4_9RHOB|nr:hypothetical protein [Roseobacter sp. WL0113]MCV3273781.1 hypothetical protein [Roseobacter sp. WL0113]